MIYKRNIRHKLEKALLRSPVTLLTGARQTGKTTLIKDIAKEKGFSYITFDDLRFLAAAKNDPVGFLAGLPKPAILDEVQRVPEIFLVIKHDVDENRIPGRYALTGSANPLLIPRLGDSLAGRMEIFELMPLSQGELNDIDDRFIDWIFSNQPPTLPQQISKQELYQKVIVGGYPLVQNIDEEARESWFNSYVAALLQRDIKDLAQISGLTELPNLLNMLATRVGSLLNVAELSRTVGIPITTLHRYLTLLQTIFLVNLQDPWSSNLGKRLVKSPKVYLADTGLLSFLLHIKISGAFSESRGLGGILENFIQSELLKQSSWSQTKVNLYHFRTQTGIEVDIVLESNEGKIAAIEVKNSDTITASDFKGIKYLQETIGDKFFKGIVLYSGAQIIPFGSNLFAMPISSLWSLNNNF